MNSNLAGVRFNVLDSFRGLSALFVVFFHMNIAGTMTQTSFLKKSDVFVSFFFILSGFVLSHGYLYKKISFKKFFLSRLIRIYPLHFVFLIAFLCIEILKYVLFNFYGMSFSNVPFEGGNTIEDLLLNSILLHSWVPEISHSSFNYPSWSISVEFYIYLFFFLFLVMMNNMNFCKYFLLFISFVLLPIFYYCFFFLELNVINKYVDQGIVCFSLGFFIYRLRERLVLKCTLCSTILEVVLLLFIYMSVESYTAYFYIPIFGLCVFVFSYECGFLSKYLFKDRIFIYIGKISYSIYMTHVFVISIAIFLSVFIGKMLNVDLFLFESGVRVLNFGGTVLNNFVLFFLVLAILCLSHFTWKYVEIRGSQYLRSKLLIEER